MTRDEYVSMACAMGLRPFGNEALRREHTTHLKATAEAMADALGLEEGQSSSRVLGRLTELEEMVRSRDTRIRELEEQLEQATAPAAKRGK